MADNSLEVQKDVVPFHPCLTPRGSTWYNLKILTPLQQKLLNELKIDVIKENHQYLARHPEIRAIIALFLRAVLTEQPKLKTIADFAKDFFSRSQIEIQCEINEYLLLRDEPSKKDVDSAINVEVSRPSSVDDLTSLFHQYYTYVSYTDESTPAEEAPDWSSYEDIEHLHHKPTKSLLTDQTIYSSSTDTTTTDSDYERRQFELLFASRASLYSGEASLEASTIDLTKEYMTYFGGVPSDTYRPNVPDYDDEDTKILKEIRLSEEINDKLSIIIENIEEEEHEEDEFEYEQMQKRLVLEMDLVSLKEKLADDDNGFQGETGPRPSQNESFILERMLDYTIGAEG